MSFRHGNRKLIRITAVIGVVMSIFILISTMSNILENRILSKDIHALLIISSIVVVLALFAMELTFSSEKQRLNQDRKIAVKAIKDTF